MKKTIRWAMQHGVVRIAAARAAKRGDLHAQFMTEPHYREDPFPFYDRVRAAGPLSVGRLVTVTASYDVVSDVLRGDDWRAGPDEDIMPAPLGRIAAWARDPRALGPIDPPSLLVVEPPDHTRYRKLVTKVFTARAVEALRPRIQDVADRLLDDMAQRREVDLIDAYASRLPVAVIAQILGVPDEDQPHVLRLGHLAAPALDVGLRYRDYRVVEGAV